MAVLCLWQVVQRESCWSCGVSHTSYDRCIGTLEEALYETFAYTSSRAGDEVGRIL